MVLFEILDERGKILATYGYDNIEDAKIDNVDAEYYRIYTLTEYNLPPSMMG